MGGLFRNYPLTEIAMQEWAAMGCKGRKDKLTPHSYSFFGLPRGVKWCEREGVKDKLPRTLTSFYPPWQTKKDVRVGEWGVNLSFTPSLLHYFTPLGSPMQPKKT